MHRDLRTLQLFVAVAEEQSAAKIVCPATRPPREGGAAAHPGTVARSKR
jgi:hypothetical protein